MTPGVTIVVTAFNHQSYVEQCLSSIRDQTRRAERVILVNDASTDDTAFVIRSWLSANDMECLFIDHTRNRGLTPSLNEALEMIETDSYIHVSTDDWLSPDRLADQYTALRSTGSDIAAVVSDFIEVDEGGRTLAVHDVGKRLRGLTGVERHNDLFSALIEQNMIPSIGVMTKTAAVRSVGGYDETHLFEDYDLWLRLSAQYGFDYDPHVASYYRVLDSSLSRTQNQKTAFLETEAKCLLKAVPHCSSTDRVALRIQNIANELIAIGASSNAQRLRDELDAALSAR